MKKYIILALASCLLFASCSNTDTLEQSIYVEDLNNPGLPQYSEWGYNTFGAYIDRSIFVSNNEELPAKIIVTADTFNLRLAGEWNGMPLTLKFSIRGFNPQDYKDLTVLNDSVFNLASENCSVTMYQGFAAQKLNVFEGQLYFKRVQRLFVDKELSESILSGYFSFKTFYQGEPIAISKGRFDLGIGYDNFYRF